MIPREQLTDDRHGLGAMDGSVAPVNDAVLVVRLRVEDVRRVQLDRFLFAAQQKGIIVVEGVEIGIERVKEGLLQQKTVILHRFDTCRG